MPSSILPGANEDKQRKTNEVTHLCPLHHNRLEGDATLNTVLIIYGIAALYPILSGCYTLIVMDLLFHFPHSEVYLMLHVFVCFNRSSVHSKPPSHLKGHLHPEGESLRPGGEVGGGTGSLRDSFINLRPSDNCLSAAEGDFHTFCVCLCFQHQAIH